VTTPPFERLGRAVNDYLLKNGDGQDCLRGAPLDAGSAGHEGRGESEFGGHPAAQEGPRLCQQDRQVTEGPVPKVHAFTL